MFLARVGGDVGWGAVTVAVGSRPPLTDPPTPCRLTPR